MRALLSIIGFLSLLTGLWNLANGFYIFTTAKLITHQTVSCNVSIFGGIMLLVFVTSIGFIMLLEKK